MECGGGVGCGSGGWRRRRLAAEAVQDGLGRTPWRSSTAGMAAANAAIPQPPGACPRTCHRLHHQQPPALRWRAGWPPNRCFMPPGTLCRDRRACRGGQRRWRHCRALHTARQPLLRLNQSQTSSRATLVATPGRLLLRAKDESPDGPRQPGGAVATRCGFLHRSCRLQFAHRLLPLMH